jgi:phytoene dehydrogenase-like protein
MRNETSFHGGLFESMQSLKKQVWEEALKSRSLPFAYQIVIHPELAQLFGDEHGPLYVTFHETIDRNGQNVEDEITMTASIHTNPENWLSYSKEEYKQKKEQLLQVVLAEIENAIPVKEHLHYAEAGTPLTYKKFIGKAEVGGFPLTVKNAILKPKSIRSSLPNLYIVGEQAFPGPGTLSAALSGYFAARAIMKESGHERH